MTAQLSSFSSVVKFTKKKKRKKKTTNRSKNNRKKQRKKRDDVSVEYGLWVCCEIQKKYIYINK